MDAMTNSLGSSALSLLFQYWYLWAVILFAFWFSSPKGKGFLGEMVVNWAIKRSLPDSDYKLLKNITIKISDKDTTQIDHIIVSRYGIFVIETKNYKGWIFGGEKQKTWTQKIYKNSSKFQNPLHQNYKHTMAIKEMLGLSSDQIFSFVSFIGDSEFKTAMPQNVTQGTKFINIIKLKRDVVIEDKDIDRLVNEIKSGSLRKGIITNIRHKNNVKAIIDSKLSHDKSTATPICPKCGSEMVKRKAKSGANSFWGCSSFPKCRSIINI